MGQLGPGGLVITGMAKAKLLASNFIFNIFLQFWAEFWRWNQPSS
jgi:hypothetical protein